MSVCHLQKCQNMRQTKAFKCAVGSRETFASNAHEVLTFQTQLLLKLFIFYDNLHQFW